MRFVGGEITFELQVVAYQFPQNATAEYDSNWLIIEGAVRHPRGDWKFRDPSLLTYEAMRLANWLEAIASGTELRPWCGFIEPNLSFDVAGKGTGRVLRVTFGCESLPPWALRGEEVTIEFPVSGLNLESAIALLRGQLREFPQRAER